MKRGPTIAFALGLSLMAAGGMAHAAEPAPFADTDWMLAEFGGESFAPAVKTEAHVIFRSNGKLSGYAFCNSMFSSYTSEGGKLAIKPIGTTMRACVEAADNDREQAFLKALRAVQGWQVEDGKLALLDEKGTVLARFVAGTP